MTEPVRLDSLPSAGQRIIRALVAANETDKQKPAPVIETTGSGRRAGDDRANQRPA